MGFLDGFMKNDKVLGIKYGIGGLIDQIDNENKTPILNEPWTKAEKKETFAKIISTTLEWAEAAGLKNGYESKFHEVKSSDVKNGNKITLKERINSLKNL